MLIGICYDLKDDYLKMGFSKEEAAEFDLPDTIDAIDGALRQNGHQVTRIGNIFELSKKLSAGGRWDLVFNITEGIYGFGREAVVPALLEQYRIPYTFSDPLTLAVSLHKGFCKRVLSYHGVANAPFCEIDDPEGFDYENHGLVYPLFAKPVAEGTSKGIDKFSRITSASELRKVAGTLFERFRQPVLVEEFLSGREFTVGVIGTGREARVIGAMEISLRPGAESEIYSLQNKENYKECVDYFPVPADEIASVTPLVLQAWRVLNCRDGGRVDVRYDRRGNCNVIEINPLAGLHPVHSDLPIICGMFGISYRELIGWIVESAVGRIK